MPSFRLLVRPAAQLAETARSRRLVSMKIWRIATLAYPILPSVPPPSKLPWPRPEVGKGRGHAEGNDEGQRRRHCCQPEYVCREQWENGSLLPEHAADQRIDTDQQAELGEVRPESECDRWRARCGCGHPAAIGRF